MTAPKTIYDLLYFSSRSEAAELLELFSDERRPIFLPEFSVVRQVCEDLQQTMEEGKIQARQVLLAYQKLKESAFHTDVFCGWKDSQGNKCGAFCDIEVTALGPYYQCRVDKSHRTPK